MKKSCSILITVLILSACATPTDIPFRPVTTYADSAVLYVFQSCPMFRSIRFFVNGEQKFYLTCNSYGYVYLQEGTHNLKFYLTGTLSTPSEGNISVLAGHEYYVMVGANVPTVSTLADDSILNTLKSIEYAKESWVGMGLLEKRLALTVISETTLAKGVIPAGEAIAPLSSAELSKSSVQDIELNRPYRESQKARDMRSLLIGSTWSRTTEDGTKIHVYVAPDGKLFGKSMTKQNIERNDTGTWVLNHKGSFCRTWNNWLDKKPGCLLVTPIADNRYLIQAYGEAEQTEVVIRQGDPEQLGGESAANPDL